MSAPVTLPWRARRLAAEGGLAALPLALANVPFAVAYALGAAAAGLSPFRAILLSLLVYAGSAQLVAVGLVGAGAGPLGLAAAVWLVNLRHVLLGASIARVLGPVGPAGRAVLAFGLTDEAFALSIGPLAAGAGPAFLAGAEAGLFVVWQGSVALAVYLGASLRPSAWLPLELVLPLSMLALLATAVRRRRDLAVALAAAFAATGTALAGAGAFATAAGIVAGALVGGLPSGGPARAGSA